MARLFGVRGWVVACVALGLSSAVLAAEPESPRAGGSGGRRERVLTAAQKAAKKKRGRRPAARPEAPAEAEKSAPAPADGELKFSRDIAPILVANCSGCHNPKQKRGKLDMSTFEKLMEGTPKEKVIAPGKPEESHLVLRIKGEETPKMPQGANRNLSDAAIARIEQWVKAGAVLDKGIDAKAEMVKYAASPDDLRKTELAKMSPDQRDKQVEAVGKDRWKKASPKDEPEVTPGAHFLLFSRLPKARAAAALKAVEGQFPQARGLLGPGAVDWGEKASLFVFNNPASFGEFVRATENRDVESGETGTSRLNVPQPYVAVVDPLGGRDEPAGSSALKRAGRGRRGADDDGGTDRTLAGVLTEQFVIGAASKAGKPPRWLSLGLGALFASRVEPRSGYYPKLRRDAYQIWQLGWLSKANDALGDATKAEDMRAVGFAVLEWLGAANRASVPPFVQGMLGGGEKLDEVIGNVLNGSREQFLMGSGGYIEAQYGQPQ